jgi:hypothetical protein
MLFHIYGRERESCMNEGKDGCIKSFMFMGLRISNHTKTDWKKWVVLMGLLWKRHCFCDVGIMARVWAPVIVQFVLVLFLGAHKKKEPGPMLCPEGPCNERHQLWSPYKEVKFNRHKLQKSDTWCLLLHLYAICISCLLFSWVFKNY